MKKRAIVLIDDIAIILLVRRRIYSFPIKEKTYKRREENMEMTENQRTRLIEWLKSKGMTDTEIVECLTYINKE